MSIEGLLADLSRADVRLWVEDSRLRFNAPKGALRPELRDRLVQHKDAIIAHLGDAARHEGPPPLSFIQEQYWATEEMNPGSAAYNVPIAFTLRGELDRGALEQALAAIVERHEVLRTTCATVDGRPVLTHHERMPSLLAITDLRALPPEERRAQVDRISARELARPFDLAKGPFLHAALIVIDDFEHRLVVTTHHFVADGWSIGIILRELGALYAAFLRCEAPALEKPKARYRDYAAWQRTEQAAQLFEGQIGYWREKLGRTPPVLDLPTDRPRPPVATLRGGLHPFIVPRPLVEALTNLGRREKVTLNIVLLAAFQVLLHRYSGQDDLIVASSVSNRGRRELEGVVGSFANNLMIRGDLSGNPTFSEFVARVRKAAFEAYAHQDLPFVKLAEGLGIERAPSRPLLFQVMMVLHDAFDGALEMPELSVTRVLVPQETARIDLTLEMAYTSDGLLGTLEYNADLFDAATAARMASHLLVLLEGLAADSTQRIGAVPMLTEAERRRFLVEYNDTAGPYPDDVCLHELFAAQAAKTPGALAVVAPGARITYAALTRAVNHVAVELRAAGARPNELVAVVMEKGWEQVVATLAIMQAGAAYLPLDAGLPRGRLEQLLRHADVKMAVIQARLEEEISLPDGLLVLAVDEADLEAAERPALPRAQRPEDLAYVIYTSGSSGAPKGVMIDHRGAVNTIADLNERFGVGPSDRIFALSSLSFDLSVYDFFGALAAGAAVVIPRPSELRDPEAWADWIAAEQVTVWNSVPALMTMLVDHEAHVAGGRGDRIASIRQVWLSGDWIPLTLPDRIRALVPHAKVISMGGATEASIWSIFYPIGHVDPAWPSIPYGMPLKNQQFYVLDDALEPCAIGIAGMLYIGGIGVAMGYLNAPDLTRAAFIVHPRTGQRLYRTGDLGRYLADGVIQFVGRRDFQVKIGGYRIELGEIETSLSQHPDVHAAVVEACADRTGAKRLVAYVVPNEDGPPAAAALRTFLRERLPDYMVPVTYVSLEAFPLSSNGKVDRRMLPAPRLDEPCASSIPPRTSYEQTLYGIWASVLRAAEFGVNDNFFELGGDSILAIQVVSRAGQAGLRISARQVFENPTIEGLASVVGTASAADAEQGPVTGAVPLTPIQEWFFSLDLPRIGHWNQAVLLDARVPVDARAMEEAVERLIEHHDALRVRFARNGAAWSQRCSAPGGPVPFERVDLSGHPVEEHAARIARAGAEAQASLDIEAGPALRVVLFDRGADFPERILFAVHHLAIDGVSWRILLEDLHIAYAQAAQGIAISLPAKTSSFKRWAEWVRSYARTEAPVEAVESFWLSPEQALTTPVPRDLAGGANTEASMRVVRRAIDEEETRALLHGSGGPSGARIDDLLLAALSDAWTRWTGQESLRVDLEAHGREPDAEGLDLSRTVGWFTALYPVVLSCGEDDLRARVEQVKDRLRTVPRHGLDFGVARYVTGGDVGAKLAALPRAEIAFNNLGQLDQTGPSAFALHMLTDGIGPLHAPEGARTHLIEVLCAVTDGCLRAMFLYSENVHRAETIERFASDFTTALSTLARATPEPTGYRSAEFAHIDLDANELGDLLAEISPGEEDVAQ